MLNLGSEDDAFTLTHTYATSNNGQPSRALGNGAASGYCFWLFFDWTGAESWLANGIRKRRTKKFGVLLPPRSAKGRVFRGCLSDLEYTVLS